VIHVEQHAHLVTNCEVAAVQGLTAECLGRAVVQQTIAVPAAGLMRGYPDEHTAPAGGVDLHLPVVHAAREAARSNHHRATAAGALAADGGEVG
jgi:hypothetical protein